MEKGVKLRNMDKLERHTSSDEAIEGHQGWPCAYAHNPPKMLLQLI